MFPFVLAATDASTSGSGFYSIALISALGPIAVAALGIVNHRKGQSRERSRKSEYSELRLVIDRNQEKTEQKIDEVHERVSKWRDTLSARMDEFDACVENAQHDATKALHASIGVDGENGNRGNIHKLETRVDRLEQARLADPRSVGAYKP